MRLARWIFLVAGVFGLIPVVHLTLGAIVDGGQMLPDLASAGLFLYVSVLQYGLWQVLFITLATNPIRYRPMMVVAFFVEVTAAFNPAWIYLYGAVFGIPIVTINLVLAILFLVAFWFTRKEHSLRTA